jgi:hypothetical protein
MTRFKKTAASKKNKYMLNPIKQNIDEGISIFTAIKNRKEHLEQALQTWINLPLVDEIIIVDWSSQQSLIDLVEKFQDGRIVLAEVPDQKKWILSCAYNLAARLTTKNKIFKVDSDIKIYPDFFKSHHLKPSTFFSGYYKLARDQNEKHLNGTVFLYREDFFNVNGYCEYIKSYGWEDSDFYKRLEKNGIQRKYFDLNTLSHIEHEARHENQNDIYTHLNLTEKQISDIKIFTNRYLCGFMPSWGHNYEMSRFKIKKITNNLLQCEQIKKNSNVVPQEIIEQSKKSALKYFLGKKTHKFPDHLINSLSSDELLLIYDILESKDRLHISKILYDLLLKLNNSNKIKKEKS